MCGAPSEVEMSNQQNPKQHILARLRFQGAVSFSSEQVRINSAAISHSSLRSRVIA